MTLRRIRTGLILVNSIFCFLLFSVVKKKHLQASKQNQGCYSSSIVQSNGYSCSSAKASTLVTLLSATS